MPIVAAYPSQVASFSTKFDFTDVVFAAHINQLQAEVAALESILGTLPQGTATTVRDRIVALEATIATLNARFDSGGLVPESGVNGLLADLANRSLVGHGHAESDVSGLIAALAGKAASAHGHAEGDITSLVGDLGGKAPSVHTHTSSQVTDLSSASVAAAANATHATNADNATNASAVPWSGITGKPLTNMNFGNRTVTTDSLGEAVIPHGMSPAPTAALLTHWTGGGHGGPILVTLRYIDSTNLGVHFWNGTANYASITVNVMWLALR